MVCPTSLVLSGISKVIYEKKLEHSIKRKMTTMILRNKRSDINKMVRAILMKKTPQNY